MQTLFNSLIFLMIPAWVYALGLGNIDLKSAPGQPLEAAIQLRAASTDELDELSVGLADIAAFRWAGMDWSPALDKLQFELLRDDNGADYIRIHSNEALQASYIRFLMEVAWSKGRLFREYTAQLDATGAGEKPARSTPEFIPDLAGDNDLEGTEPAVLARGDYGPVAPSETLWSIAGRFRPDSSVSVQQMMLVLLKTNPDAFIYNNINWLKKDEILRMPDRVELQALSVQEAFSEVLAQNRLWLEAGGRFVGNMPVQPGSTTAEADAELRLVAATGDGEDGNGAPAADPEGSVDAEALVLANEQVEMLSHEKVELEDKLSEAEAIIEDLRRLVELKDDELAALQSQSVTAPAKPEPDLLAQGKSIFNEAVALVRDNLKIAAGALAGIIALVVAGLLLARRKPDNAAGEQETSVDTDLSDLSGEADTEEPDFSDEADTEAAEGLPDLEIDVDDDDDAGDEIPAPGFCGWH